MTENVNTACGSGQWFLANCNAISSKLRTLEISKEHNNCYQYDRNHPSLATGRDSLQPARSACDTG